MSPNPPLKAPPTSGSDIGDNDKSADYPKPHPVRHELAAHATRDILLLLIAFRILNALSISTFFQPDEYFQSLEPAWQMAFGEDSGAWITWEWKHRLRSSIHPALFALVYKVAEFFSRILHLSPQWHAELLLASPKVLQGLFGALGDYSTWTLSQKIHGKGSIESWAAVCFQLQDATCPPLTSPWNWFCSTRTLSNCLETTMTIAALNLWPWQWSLESAGGEAGKMDVDEDGLRTASKMMDLRNRGDVLTDLRRCLLLAALACVLRPTNILIWICLTWLTLFRAPVSDLLASLRHPGSPPWAAFSNVQFRRATLCERYVLIREAFWCGALILVLAALVDRAYYNEWTFPPLRFLYFNLAQSLAAFYGHNDWHYYVSQGFPLLLTTMLPFGAIGLWQSLDFSVKGSPNSQLSLSLSILHQLALTALLVPLSLSLISHKEVRFIFPLLPSLHILAAHPFSAFFAPPAHSSLPRGALRRILLVVLLSSSLAIANFTTNYHQPGPLAVLSYLRDEHISTYLTQPPSTAHLPHADSTMSVGFLMPCHSTPWRSHLIFPSIKAWALSCEPPVNLDAIAKATYLDEADLFYLDPKKFLEERLGDAPKKKGWFGRSEMKRGLGLQHVKNEVNWAWDGKEGEKMWPDYLVFFQALEPMLGEYLRDSVYGECWRGWNSFFHDDSRRTGDVVVWCLKGANGV